MSKPKDESNLPPLNLLPFTTTVVATAALFSVSRGRYRSIVQRPILDLRDSRSLGGQNQHRMRHASRRVGTSLIDSSSLRW